MVSYKFNMTVTNNSLVSAAWTCKDWETELFSDKTVSSWFLNSAKMTQKPGGKKLCSNAPKCCRHRTVHVLAQNIGWSHLSITLRFSFCSPTPTFIVWPFQFKYCKFLGMKSEMQLFAAPTAWWNLPSESCHWEILEAQPRVGSFSSPSSNPTVGSASGIGAPRGASVRNLSLLGPECRADKWQAHTLQWETKPPQPVWSSKASLVSPFQTSCRSWMWGHCKWCQATYLKAIWVYSFHRCLFFFFFHLNTTC